MTRGDRLYQALPLAIAYLLLVILYGWQTRGHVTPWLFTDELKLFADATTDTLHQHIDEIVNIGGIISQIKRSKIKKGPNEGKIMAKFVLDDQFGSVDVVVFSDLYSKYARWLDNGVAVLLTASVKDTGGVQAGRSAALQSAEQHAHRPDDEYGRISAYDVDDDDDLDLRQLLRAAVHHADLRHRHPPDHLSGLLADLLGDPAQRQHVVEQTRRCDHLGGRGAAQDLVRASEVQVGDARMERKDDPKRR